MKSNLSIGSSAETRRQFIERNGLLIVAGLIHPCASLANLPTKLSPGKNRQQKEAQEISPIEDLMREHGVLARILLIYDEIISRLNRGEKFPLEVLSSLPVLIRRFVEDYHEKLEENQIFPRFKKAGKLVDLVTLLAEQHRAGRRLTDRIKSLADSSQLKNPDERRELRESLQLFIRMYRPHKAREDTVLFPAFHAIVSSEEFDSLGEAFEDEEERLFGKDGFDSVVREVENREVAMGIHELSRFTPSR
jgi:hemerythrin-like domain-containing protein